MAARDYWRPTLDAYEPSLVRASDLAARFVADMAHGKPAWWLTLTGDPGCGKTMLAQQVFEQAQRINPGHPDNGAFWNVEERGPRPACVWLDASGFAERMRDGEYRLPTAHRDDWCVVLDDLGTARDKSDWIADGIYRFCNSRLGKWTVITSNFSLREIANRIDERVASRIIRGTNIAHRIEAVDYALKPNNKLTGSGSTAEDSP